MTEVIYTVEVQGDFVKESITFEPGEWESMSDAEREDTMLDAINNQLNLMGVYTGWEVQTDDH